MSNQAAEWQAEQIQQEARKRAAERARAAAEGPQSGHTCVTCGKITTCDAAQHGETGGCSYWAASRDSVNHPAHYTAGGVECIEAIKAATEGLPVIQAESFNHAAWEMNQCEEVKCKSGEHTLATARCTRCKRWCEAVRDWTCRVDYRYCPNCGAKMKNEIEGDTNG